jgi:hypothetical protein
MTIQRNSEIHNRGLNVNFVFIRKVSASMGKINNNKTMKIHIISKKAPTAGY